jgi:hypothetical protein
MARVLHAGSQGFESPQLELTGQNQELFQLSSFISSYLIKRTSPWVALYVWDAKH